MNFKRILSLMLAVMMIVFSAIPVSAAETDSEVYADLTASKLDGVKFDPTDYPKDATDTGVYLLTVNERGYKTTDMSNYGFYVYLYNPSGIALSVSSTRNQIQMATAWDSTTQLPTDWAKFNLEFVSVSDEEGYEYVYYKFKVGSEVNGTNTLANYIEPLGRFYDISGFEVQKMSITNATESTVDMRYAYYGTEAAGNKTCKASIIDTLELEVHHTYFRTESSSHGVGHQNQLNAVYFNVPADYWLTYDFLYSIEAYWEEYRTTPMIVTDNTTVASLLTTWRGRGNGSGYNSSNPLSLYSEPAKGTSGNITVWTYPWTYNTEMANTTAFRTVTLENSEAITWSFLSDEIELRQADISSQTVLDYWETHGETYRERMITEEGVNEFYNDRVAGPQTHSIRFDETFEMASYSSNHNWLQQLLHYNIFNGGAGTNLKDDYSGIIAIEDVSSAHVNLRAEELAARYYVNPADADDFKSVVDAGKNNGMKTIVFRFAVTDYFAEEVTAMVNNEVVDGTTYRAEQTAFLNFDIISLTFQKEASLYTIPVSSSPSDFIGGIDSPQVDKDPSLGNAGEYFKDLFDGVSGFKSILRLFSLMLGAVVVLMIIFLVVNIIRPQKSVVVKVDGQSAPKRSPQKKRQNRKKYNKGGKKT